MKKILLLSLLALAACGDKKLNKQAAETSVAVDTVGPYLSFERIDSRPVGSNLPDNIVVKNVSLFPKEFIEELEISNYPEEITYTDDYVITNGDTIAYPDMLKIGKEYFFEGINKGEYFGLKVKRKSICEIEYHCFAQEDEVLDDVVTGVVSLPSFFFFDTNEYKDNVTGKEFSVSTYLDMENSTNYIGFSNNGQDKLLAVIKLFKGWDADEGAVLRQVEKLKY
ncbi:hypothetical protein FUA48_11045 [Flavobacterium alkalisoli]|uniref:Lipoprotein n=1 Tax=Flavobacterium alkalisoli TaxID=2602769 RepID=A0A5B9FT00_9FLAO|nr:hypothetical protein [Flavobacterium alkalisoli]QEE50095.1 hypothetical protein FUA48_11045 [Flavobacterium alkalisoli]